MAARSEGFDTLPVELLINVLSWLDAKSLLTVVGRVCRAWRATAGHVRGVSLDLRFLAHTPRARLRQPDVGAGFLAELADRFLFRWVVDVDLTGFLWLDDAAVAALAERCPKLQSANFEFCDKLTDAAAMTLAAGCPGLLTVNLESCNLTDAGLIALAEGCRGLRSVTVDDCPPWRKRGDGHCRDCTR
jgi:hypothetical protein